MTYPNPNCCIQLANGAQIPLEGVHIKAQLLGLCSEVTVAHRYRNTETVPLEAVYTFPLETGAAVCAFEAQIGERRVVGKVLERDEAFERYDDAMADGHGAFLLDQERPNIFTASLGNLQPGQEVTVQITYVALLNLEGEAVRFTLPTTIAPRYTPANAPEVGQPDAERINPPTLLSVPYGLTLEVDVEAHAPIRCVESPSHTIRTELDGTKARVTLSARDASMDRDFVLLVEPREQHEPIAHVSAGDNGERVVMVTFRPDAADLREDGGQEISFILDCSGSMGGDSIEEARRALELCIRAMSEADTFNVIPFGSHFKPMWAEPRPYNQAHLDEAVAFVRRCDATLGDTEILAPMRHVLERPADPKRPRKVLLLTDGEVSNEDQVIALARERRATANVFAFGIGAGCSEHLVRGVATASRGAAEFIYPGERIEPKVLRTFGRLRTPVMADLRLDWGELRVDMAQAEVPPIFAGDAMTVFAKVQGGTADRVTLRAGEREWSVPLDLERATTHRLVPTLWARKRIDELEQDRAPRGSNQRRGNSDRKVSRIVEIALTYNLMSAHTSFVAIDERSEADKTVAQAELRRVPTALTAGWGGQQSLARGGAVPAKARRRAPSGPMTTGAPMPAPAPAAMRRPAAPSMMAPGGAAPAAQRTKKMSPERAKGGGGFLDRAAALFGLGGGDYDAPAEACYDEAFEGQDGGASALSDAGGDLFYEVLMKQYADGHFPWTDAVAELFGADASRVREAIGGGSDPDVVATACVVWWFENRLADRSAEWGQAVAKAGRWLATQPTQFDAGALFATT